MTKSNQKLNILALVFAGFALLCLILVLFLKSPLFRAELVTLETHLEIGCKADTNPTTYLEGNDIFIPLSYVDTSAVKHTKIGRYPVYIYHGFQKFTSYVNVTDTTPPTVHSDVKNKTILPGDTISVHSLGLKIEDYSEIERVIFSKISSTKFYTGLPEEETEGIREAYRKGISMETEEFQFAYGGIYTLTIRVQDAFYNTSETELILTVEEPPVIDVTQDFYVADTENIDFTKYIHVWDFISGDMDVNDIVIDDSQLKLSSAGTYPVTLSIADDYGLTASKTIYVHVSSQEALQSLINTHKVNIATNTIIGAQNAYDSGYYTSLAPADIHNVMKPTVVHLSNDALPTHGNGFIIEINEEFVTITTHSSVIANDLEIDVTFFDDTKCIGAVVASSPERGIAFIRIPIDGKNSNSSLPSEYVKKLRTVHINKGYWEQYKDRIQTLPSASPIAGTPLWDTYGQLVGMIQNDSTIPLDEILNYFEVVFKYKIHYQ